MTTGLPELAISSATGSLLAYGIVKCLKAVKDKTRVIGCLIPNGCGRTYAEKHLCQEDILFYDIDGALSVQPLKDVEKSKMRLELFPQAREKLKQFKTTHKGKVLIVMTSQIELLRHLKLHKNAFTIVPTDNFINGLPKDNQSVIQLQKATYLQIVKNKKRQIEFNTFEFLTDVLTKLKI